MMIRSIKTARAEKNERKGFGNPFNKTARQVGKRIPLLEP